MVKKNDSPRIIHSWYYFLPDIFSFYPF